MADPTNQTTPLQEFDDADMNRAVRLLRECGNVALPRDISPSIMLAAYTAVLLKDVRFGLSELVYIKQNEMQR